MANYTYSSIQGTTRHGVFITKYCDYYVQDGLLTIFRNEQIETGNRDYGNKKIHKVLEKHYPMERVIEIECVR